MALQTQPSSHHDHEAEFDENLAIISGNDEPEATANVSMLLEAPPTTGDQSVCYHCIIAAAHHHNGDFMEGLTVAKCVGPAMPNLLRLGDSNCNRKSCANDGRKKLTKEEAKQDYSIREFFAKFILSRVVKNPYE
jgi:hypothetical protein